MDSQDCNPLGVCRSQGTSALHERWFEVGLSTLPQSMSASLSDSSQHIATTSAYPSYSVSIEQYSCCFRLGCLELALILSLMLHVWRYLELFLVCTLRILRCAVMSDNDLIVISC